MTDKEFCKIETAISGEEIDKVEQLTHCSFTGRELKEYLEQVFVIHGVNLSLPDAKQTVAEMYSKKDWQDVLRDYEYGFGISKMIGFEDLMDKVAEVYKGNEA